MEQVSLDIHVVHEHLTPVYHNNNYNYLYNYSIEYHTIVYSPNASGIMKLAVTVFFSSSVKTGLAIICTELK